MNEKLLIQYQGFEPKPLVRQYSFKVLEAGETREFTLTIANEAFLSHRVRYQDAPDICTLRLRRELAEGQTHPTKTHFRVSETDLDDYRAAHLTKQARHIYGARPKETP